MAEEKKEEVRPGLAEYISAGYPCLFLPTVEPEVAVRRIRSALDEALDDKKKVRAQFGIWKVTTGMAIGMVTMPPDQPLRKLPDRQDLIDALAYVAEQREPTMVVFHNVREYLKNPGVIQQMVDSILTVRLRGSHIFLVGPYLDVPPELRSLITYVDCSLPTRQQIQEDYQRLVKAYEDEMELPEDKTELDDLLRHAATAAVGLDSMGAENALSLSLATVGEIDLRVIQAQKEQEVRKSDVLEFINIDASMDEVGGFNEYKNWIRKRVRVFTDEAREYGLPYPKGILIVGPAGTGKSLVAKATASYLRLPCLRMDMGKIFRSLVGESEAAIRMALQVVEAVAPAVLWIKTSVQFKSGEFGGTLTYA